MCLENHYSESRFIAQFDKIVVNLCLKHIFRSWLGATFENFVMFETHFYVWFTHLIELVK